jgi:hypothetical protein
MQGERLRLFPPGPGRGAAGTRVHGLLFDDVDGSALALLRQEIHRSADANEKLQKV